MEYVFPGSEWNKKMKLPPVEAEDKITGGLTDSPARTFVESPPLLANTTALENEPCTEDEKRTGMFAESNGAMSKELFSTMLDSDSKK